jgi:hypothetical protein
MNNGETDANLLERHYRVTLDFRVLVMPITPEVCRESFFFNEERASAGEPDFLENVERQRRLYGLLRSNQPALEQYLLSVLAQEAGRFASDGLTDALDLTDEDELLVPLYRTMAKEDAEFFEECRGLGALAENTELIAAAFEVEWVGVEVGEMNRRVVGDVERAEIVERTKTRLIRTFNSIQRQSER